MIELSLSNYPSGDLNPALQGGNQHLCHLSYSSSSGYKRMFTHKPQRTGDNLYVPSDYNLSMWKAYNVPVTFVYIVFFYSIKNMTL